LELQSTPICPICDGSSELVQPIPDRGEMRKCLHCGLFFADPMALPTTSKDLYSRAYKGNVNLADMRHFANRMRYRRILLGLHRMMVPQHMALTLKWIRRNLPKGSTVLDIGCGPGWFLHTLRRYGYRPIGIEPGELPVLVLKQEGFEVWHGTLESYPASWPEPDAVTSFFMLHHLPDPRGFFSTLRNRFPHATVFVSDHHYMNRVFGTREARQRALPPRFLTWWTGQSLKTALTKAGFETTVSELPYNIRDGLVFGSTNAFLDIGTSVPTFLAWLLRGDRNQVEYKELGKPEYPANFWQRLRRFRGIPWSLWGKASPRP